MKKQIMLLTFFLSILISPAALAKPNTPTYYPGQEWRRSTPEQQGMDSKVLLQMYQTYGNDNRIVIIRNGYLVSGYPSSVLKTDLYHLYSCTKSVISTLIGIALNEGYLKNIDQKVLSFFPKNDLPEPDDLKQKITLRHLLTMSSGILWNDVNVQDSIVMSGTSDWVRFVLERPMAAKPGTVWNYNSGGSHLLSTVLQKMTGRTAAAYAGEKLFKPLGITKYRWQEDPQGHSIGGWGLYLSLFDLSKIGYLFVKTGVWKGQTIVPGAWINQSTQTCYPARSVYGYGYQWWIYPDLPYRGYSAHGALGGNHVVMMIFSEPDLVVVMAGKNGADRDLLKSFIIPSLKSMKPLPPNSQAVAEINKLLN